MPQGCSRSRAAGKVLSSGAKERSAIPRWTHEARQRRMLSSFTRPCGGCLYNRDWFLVNLQLLSTHTLMAETNSSRS